MSIVERRLANGTIVYDVSGRRGAMVHHRRA
jgi:hypothetical protein